jgi:hypothetical protein
MPPVCALLAPDAPPKIPSVAAEILILNRGQILDYGISSSSISLPQRFTLTSSFIRSRILLLS